MKNTRNTKAIKNESILDEHRTCIELPPKLQKYDSPKIMLVDIQPDLTKALKALGFNIDIGSFGYLYYTRSGDPCYSVGDLPYLSEKEVVIVDLNYDKEIRPKEQFDLERIHEGKTILSVPFDQKYINTRNYYAYFHKDIFSKILNKGGIIILFSSCPEEIESYFYIKRGHQIVYDDKTKFGNYSWLLPFTVYPKHAKLGRDIVNKSRIIDVEGEYECIFGGIPDDSVLFSNRFGECIGFIQNVEDGLYVVLPNFNDKLAIINNLITNILPEIKPDIFPDFVLDKWIDEEEYSYLTVKELNDSKVKIIEEYEKKLSEFDIKIQQEKGKYQFLYNILSVKGYDDFLVDNVYSVFSALGYQDITKLDDIVEGNPQEDLRIQDNGQYIVIEIKGKTGNCSEDDCQALLKYINRNMKKTSRVDIHGILILNHQKNLPPKMRSSPFTKEQIEDAKRDGYTLISTWDLFQCVRLFQEGIIDLIIINSALNRSGLFKLIDDANYIGKIQKLYQDGHIVCVYLETEDLATNSKIIVREGIDYSLETIQEMQVNDVTVETAKKGDKLSIKFNRRISAGACIYKYPEI